MKFTKYTMTVLFLLGIMTACKENGTGGPQFGMDQDRVIPVSVVEVSEEMVSSTTNYPASVVALNETELRAEVSGYITNILVSDGAYVSKGQRLYEIDKIRYQSVRDQAKANLQSAQTQLERVKRDLDRYIELDEKNAIAKQLLDYAHSDYNSAQDRVDIAKAALVNAETDLSRATIYAPFSGKIGISMVRQGALVSAGATLLNTISSTHPIGVDFQVSEKEINRFVEIQKTASNLNEATISLVMPDGSDYEKYGKITLIDRAVNPNTGTITVRAQFDNQSDALRVGMNSQIKVLNELSTPQMVIPYKAIMDQLGKTMVYIATDDLVAVPQHVVLGLKLGDRVVVEDGLQAGQKIIVDGLMNLRPNDNIQIKQPEQESAAN